MLLSDLNFLLCFSNPLFVLFVYDAKMYVMNIKPVYLQISGDFKEQYYSKSEIWL